MYRPERKEAEMEEPEGHREEYSEEDVQLLFRAVGKMHKACLRKEMDRRGLAEVGQPFILFMLRDHQEGMNWDQKQFAEALGVSPATVAISIKRMERAGLVTRVPDPEDLRRNRITITEKGRRLVDDCIRAFRHVDTGMFRGFSDEEREELAGYYRRMVRNLEELGAQPPKFMTQEEAH
jgi:DNA-binding MarR family transcriptional regulator